MAYTMGGTNRVRIPLGAKDFSHLQIVHTDSGAHTVSHLMGTAFFLWTKAAAM
jgi:hypothetical protein